MNQTEKHAENNMLTLSTTPRHHASFTAMILSHENREKLQEYFFRDGRLPEIGEAVEMYLDKIHTDEKTGQVSYEFQWRVKA